MLRKVDCASTPRKAVTPYLLRVISIRQLNLRNV
jgi:hypothetical protein